MSASHAETIREFYGAFARKDGDAMAAAYAPNVHFRDPAFGDLHGEEPGAMWRMLTGRAEDLEVELVDHDDSSAHWLAHYTFSTGRHVDNDVRASFEFNAEGKITEHIDDFDFYAWARQALGPVGLALGWTPIIKGGVRKKARAQLDEFMKR
jgi:ketosteroid isomerase-like protein